MCIVGGSPTEPVDTDEDLLTGGGGLEPLDLLEAPEAGGLDTGRPLVTCTVFDTVVSPDAMVSSEPAGVEFMVPYPLEHCKEVRLVAAALLGGSSVGHLRAAVLASSTLMALANSREFCWI